MLFHRQRVVGVGWYGFGYSQPAQTYTALVAPGCDLLWIASLISALEIVSWGNV